MKNGSFHLEKKFIYNVRHCCFYKYTREFLHTFPSSYDNQSFSHTSASRSTDLSGDDWSGVFSARNN